MFFFAKRLWVVLFPCFRLSPITNHNHKRQTILPYLDTVQFCYEGS